MTDRTITINIRLEPNNELDMRQRDLLSKHITDFCQTLRILGDTDWVLVVGPDWDLVRKP